MLLDGTWYSIATSSPRRAPVFFTATFSVSAADAEVTVTLVGCVGLNQASAKLVSERPWPNSKSGLGPVQYLSVCDHKQQAMTLSARHSSAALD